MLTLLLFIIANEYVYCDAWSTDKPNFIILLTDDQDLELGSIDIMPNLHSKIIENGLTLTNAFVSTPICCPSRTETMFGRYYHNAGAPNGKCMHVDGNGATFNETSMFQYFHSNGYKTGVFGKFVKNNPDYWCSNYTSIANGSFKGYDRIYSMCQAKDYYETTYIDKYSDNTWQWTNLSLTPSTYQTSQIGNASIQWLKSLKNDTTNDAPFLMWIGPHAPHEPAYPAEWYAETIFENQSMNVAPRPPSYNHYSPDKHAMIANNPSLNAEADALIDQLWRDRLKALLSVDDIIGELYSFLSDNQLLDNTYVYFSSDHGYHLGEFRVPCFKAEAYETDIRVPTYLMGPNIAKKSKLDILTGNVDIYPTFLELAGLSNDGNKLKIDGKSYAKHLFGDDVDNDNGWRDEYLVEYRATGTTYFWICGIWFPDPQTKSVFPGITVAPPQGPPGGPPWFVNDKNSSNFRMIRILNDSMNAMYAEFVDFNWTTANLNNPKFYEFYDLNMDPYQLTNVYLNQTQIIKQQLHSMLADYGACQGLDCP